MDQMEKIEKNIHLVNELVDAVVVSDRKEAICKMLSGEFGELFFTAPASSKEEYHGCFPGGLIEHSLGVYRNLRKLNTSFNCKFNEESMLLVSLFHDIGKSCCTDLKTHFYTPSDDEWKKNKGWIYEYNTKGIYMPTHQRSMFVLQYFGIKLTSEEYQSVLLNDGMYLQENRGYGLKECSLALFLHMADRISLEQEKQRI